MVKSTDAFVKGESTNSTRIEFDLFKLHLPEEDKTPRRWICAIGENLNSKIDEIVNEIVKEKSEQTSYVKLSRKIIKQIYEKGIKIAGKQQTLAKMLNIPRQDLYRWKESKTRIRETVLFKLLNFLGIQFSSIQNYIIDKKIIRKGINRQTIAKILSKKLNVSLNFTEKIIYGKRKEVALIFILKLLKYWSTILRKSKKEFNEKKKEIQETFQFLKENTGGKAFKVKAPKVVSPEFSKIIGAMIADGSLFKSLNTISIIDEDKTNLENFSNWMESVFGIIPKIRKKKYCNAWYIKIDNKVIKRYFLVFFTFSKGKKSLNYDVPLLIKKSNFEIQKAFAEGVMCFDGIVRLKKEVGINIGSKKLRDSLFEIFIKYGLKVKKSKKEDKTGMWRIYSYGKSNVEQYYKWLNYFAEGSEKWFRIFEWINGFQGSVKNTKDALIILKECFPIRSNSKITLSQFLNFFMKNKALTLNQILSILERSGIKLNINTLWEYASWLKKMNIIKKRRAKDNSNIYFLNKNINEWKLPYRPRLGVYYSSLKSL